MLYGSPYEALIADRPLAAGTVRCHLAGKHCESGDVIVRDLMLADPAPGDIVATPATGAYGYSLANNYNGVPRPPVVFCRDGAAWSACPYWARVPARGPTAGSAGSRVPSSGRPPVGTRPP